MLVRACVLCRGNVRRKLARKRGRIFEKRGGTDYNKRFNVTYNVAGNEAQEGLTNDTAKGILFQTEQTGAVAKGASLTFKNSLSGLFELNFRAFTEVKVTSGSWWDGGAWYDRTNTAFFRLPTKPTIPYILI